MKTILSNISGLLGGPARGFLVVVLGVSPLAHAQVASPPTTAQALDAESRGLVKLQRGQTKQSLDASSAVDVNMATSRLRGQAEAYTQYLMQKAALEAQLLEQTADEIKRYEALLNQDAQSLIQSRFRVKEEENVGKIRSFAEEKLKQANDAILQFETTLREDAYKQIGAYEAQIRRTSQEDVRKLEQVTQSDIQSKLAVRRAQMKSEMQEKISAQEARFLSSGAKALDAPRSASMGQGGATSNAQSTFQNRFPQETRAAPAAAQPPADVSRSWTITAYDSTLRSLLLRWAGQAGWSVVWEVDVDYPIASSKGFTGTFEDAVDSLFKAEQLRGGTSLRILLYPENRVLRISGGKS